MAKDPEFLERAKKMSQDFETQTGERRRRLVRTLDKTPPEAFDYISGMMRKQGLQGG